MSKIYQLLITFLIKPLAEKGLKALYNWINVTREDRAKKKLDKKKTTLIKKIAKAKTNEERKKLSIDLDRINNG